MQTTMKYRWKPALLCPTIILCGLMAGLSLDRAMASDDGDHSKSNGISIVDPWNAVVVTGGKNAGSKAIVDGLELTFDGRYWKKKVHEMSNPEIIQYLLPGETTQDWTELVTIHKLQGQNAKRLSPLLIAQKVWQNPQISIYSQSDNDLIYEGYTENGQRYELVRVLSGDGIIYTLFYVSRNPETFSKKRNEWLRLLGQAKIVDG